MHASVPTAARSRALYQCSCAIDRIAAKMKYDAFRGSGNVRQVRGTTRRGWRDLSGFCGGPQIRPSSIGSSRVKRTAVAAWRARRQAVAGHADFWTLVLSRDAVGHPQATGLAGQPVTRAHPDAFQSTGDRRTATGQRTVGFRAELVDAVAVPVRTGIAEEGPCARVQLEGLLGVRWSARRQKLQANLHQRRTREGTT